MKHSLLALLFVAMSALAQPYVEADITRDTACGAKAIGKVWSGPNRGQIEQRERAGVRVTAEGWWAVCTMPPKPKDCAERAVTPWRGADGWRQCEAAKHSLLRAQNVGREWEVHTASGAATWGSQRWRCERQPDGTADWTLVRSRCFGR